MKLIFVISFLCVNLVLCRQNAYRAAVVKQKDAKSFTSLIQEAGNMNVDILMLPPLDSFAETANYDEVTKSISSAAKESGVYVTVHLQENSRCKNRVEVIRNNIVFDRQGAVVADYRKPLNSASNCTSSSRIPTFTTDFGVAFALLMEEDLVLQNLKTLKLKNFLVTGDLASDIPFLRGSQFSSSWAFATKANLVTSSRIYAGRSALKPGSGNIFVVDLNKDGATGQDSVLVPPSELNIPEDLSQYIMKPLNLEASVKGYKETVCHDKFCCDFDIKTQYFGPSAVSYGLAVFDGVRHFTRGQHIGIQTCSVVACAGLYKRSCTLGPNNSTSTAFERVVISGNFTKFNSAQYPIFLSTSELHNINFHSKTITKTNHVTVTIENGENLLNFGIFSRVFGKDFLDVKNFNDYSDNFYDYIFNDEVQELFDYLWIRVRILMVIVSIYVLEMM